jgi:hypothetical protein
MEKLCELCGSVVSTDSDITTKDTFPFFILSRAARGKRWGTKLLTKPTKDSDDFF